MSDERHDHINRFRTTPCSGGCGKVWADCAFYMLRNEVWAATGFLRADVACLDCVVERLGRKLTPEDFNAAPINEPVFDVLRNVVGSRPRGRSQAEFPYRGRRT